ncbi:MAG: purine-nucleoside phosphorylase [Anaerolineae bacterium]|nr:purine-nucleoside phosphorylase [Promineifilum sp.]MCZ2114377.1 purine-nucleoside phosphorylase [Anaerolineae bacterium]HNS40356.1 purine-nucleoside phosphorylase [Promineifilum sp.]
MSQFVPLTEITAAADYIRSKTNHQPTIGLILGSGLNSLADAIDTPDIIPTSEIPHWPVSTVPGHVGRLVIGTMGGQTVLVLQGRTHFYEGYSMDRVTMPVRVMATLGIDTLIVTNASGGLNPSYQPGELMLIRDHLNFPGMAGNNPLRGPNDETFGPRFPDMTTPYDVGLRTLAHRVAADEGFELREGVYAYVAGPSFETPAELRFLQFAGGDAVGMSTASEVVVARHAGLRVLGISSIANMALPDPPPGLILGHEEVLEMGQRAVPRLIAVVSGVISRLHEAS